MLTYSMYNVLAVIGNLMMACLHISPTQPEKIMFVGMDAYHDPKIQACSVTAIVASLNRDHTKYCSMVIFQARHQEIADSLQPIVIELLRAYAEVTLSFF